MACLCPSMVASAGLPTRLSAAWPRGRSPRKPLSWAKVTAASVARRTARPLLRCAVLAVLWSGMEKRCTLTRELHHKGFGLATQGKPGRGSEPHKNHYTTPPLALQWSSAACWPTTLPTKASSCRWSPRSRPRRLQRQQPSRPPPPAPQSRGQQQLKRPALLCLLCLLLLLKREMVWGASSLGISCLELLSPCTPRR